MTIAGELINILGFRLEGEANLRKWNKGMNDAESISKKTSDRVKGLAAAAGLTTTGMIAMGTAAVKQAAQFERTMTRIGITAGATADQVKDASETVRRMAYEFAMPLDQAVAGLDTLTASGMSLEQAMAFLPSVLATAQAAGAATEDIANTAIKTSSALGIEAGKMQEAFDIMVAGGKAGQFELKDMAQYIPDMANQFANMGYKGTDGLKMLIATLQTLREDTGSAATAATNATNIFSKMFSQETEKNFKDFGVNIREEMAKAQAAGEDALKAYIRITQEVLEKNPTAKISDLFADQQFQQGMLSLITSTESLDKFLQTLNSADVNGGVFKDLGVVLDGTQTKIDRLSLTWQGFMNQLGASLSGPVGDILDATTQGMSKADAINSQLEKEGYGFWERRGWWATNGFDTEDQDLKARTFGWTGTAEDKRVKQTAPDAYRVLGRMPRRPITATPAPGAAADGIGAQSMIEAGFDNLAARVEAMNSNLAAMTSEGAVQATITDARQDNRQFPVSVSAPVTVNVSSPTAAPGAVGNAISGAIGQAATSQASRIEAEPAQP